MPGVWLQPRPAGIVPLHRPVAQPPPAIDRARGAAAAGGVPPLPLAGPAGRDGRPSAVLSETDSERELLRV